MEQVGWVTFRGAPNYGVPQGEPYLHQHYADTKLFDHGGFHDDCEPVYRMAPAPARRPLCLVGQVPATWGGLPQHRPDLVQERTPALSG